MTIKKPNEEFSGLIDITSYFMAEIAVPDITESPPPRHTAMLTHQRNILIDICTQRIHRDHPAVTRIDRAIIPIFP